MPPTPVPWNGTLPAAAAPISEPATETIPEAQAKASQPAAPNKSTLENKLRQAAARYSNMEIGIAVTDISDGEHAEIRGDRSFPMASAFKLPVMIEAARQMQEGTNGLSLSSLLTITSRTKCIGSGDMASLPDGSTVSMRQAIEKMITISDNTATDTLLDAIGKSSVNRLLIDHGLTHSSVYLTNREAWLLSLRRGVPHGESINSFLSYWNSLSYQQKCALADSVGEKYADTSLKQIQAWEDASAKQETEAQSMAIAAAVDNYGSPNDYNRLLIKLWKRQILSEEWTSYCLGVLGRQRYNSRIPGLLPKGTKVYHKTGTIAGVVNDTGIMMAGSHPVAISVFVDKVKDKHTSAAQKAIQELSLIAYKHCASKQ
ncbi:serine hydrolase [bacterium]|nr:serine hydrolase [bacterium]